MHLRIREIIHTSNYCHASVKAAVALLQEDDVELDGWMGRQINWIKI